MSIGILNNLKNHEVILASHSPRRAQLLKQIGIHFKQVSYEWNEISKQSDESLNDYVLQTARHKVMFAAKHFSNGIIICADTIVSIEQNVMGKPQNKNEAIRFLSLLSGHTHQVYTGIALLLLPLNKIVMDVGVTEVTFRSLLQSEIEDYIDNGYVYDKAGGYAIQDAGALFVEKIEGCYYNVMGFPLTKFYNLIKELLE